MNTAIPYIDISNMPDMMRLAEEVQTTKKPRILKVRGETMAMVMPVGAVPEKKRKRIKTDYETFLSAAGGWSEVDTERLKRDIYEDRKRSVTSSFTL